MLLHVVNSRVPMTVVRAAQTGLPQQAAEIVAVIEVDHLALVAAAGAMLSVVVRAAGTPVLHEQAVPAVAPVWAVLAVAVADVAGN
jgi:hypothetical protein